MTWLTHTPLAYDIVHHFDVEPETWTQTHFTVDHASGVKLWTEHGYWGFDINQPLNTTFSWFDKRFVWRAYKRWLQSRTMYQLCGKQDPRHVIAGLERLR